MTDSALLPLFAHRFQAGDAFDLVVFDRLPLDEQALLAGLRADPELYGVLKPRAANGLTVKTVDRSTALLLLTLREPGPLPFFALEGNREETARGLEQLVLDGVLKVEAEGRFVSGPEAAPALGATPLAAEPGSPSARSRLAEISLLALRHGENLELGDLPAESHDPEPLAAFLYCFHREPLTPEWAERLPDADAVLAFLGAAPGSSLRRRLEAEWEIGERESSPGWIAFQPRRSSAGAEAQGAGYKLYVSPRAAALPSAFAALATALLTRGATPFKVGSAAAGALRPDKLVAYFRSLEELLAVARELEETLRGLPAQGVPFSAPIDAAGLLSWGVDPPATSQLAAWMGPESWRQWVARRLAASLLAARGTATPESPAWSFALERLRRDGVDTDRWTPTAALWAAA